MSCHLWNFVDAWEGVEAPCALGLDQDADSGHEGGVEDDGAHFVLRGQVHRGNRPDALKYKEWTMLL